VAAARLRSWQESPAYFAAKGSRAAKFHVKPVTGANVKLYGDGTFLQTTRFREVFTAENGKSLVIFGARQASGPAEQIQERRAHDHGNAP
jgi:hypothetical protein